MAKIMKITALVTSVLTAVLAVVYGFIKAEFVFTLAISFGTTAYHFLMRLSVGVIFNTVFHNDIDYKKMWFREHGFEKRLYKFLKLRKIKKNVPTYSPETFSLKKHTLEEIVKATCQAELVHEIIIVLSFVPLLFTCVFGAGVVFLITSVVAACVDVYFVLVQRYNRPRLLRLVKLKY